MSPFLSLFSFWNAKIWCNALMYRPISKQKKCKTADCGPTLNTEHGNQNYSHNFPWAKAFWSASFCIYLWLLARLTIQNRPLQITCWILKNDYRTALWCPCNRCKTALEHPLRNAIYISIIRSQSTSTDYDPPSTLEQYWVKRFRSWDLTSSKSA